MIQEGFGEALLAYYQENLISASLFIDAYRTSLYFTGVYERGLFQYGISHYLLFEGICRSFKRGNTNLFSLGYFDTDIQDPKWYNIQFFKKGFVRNLKPVIFWSKEKHMMNNLHSEETRAFYESSYKELGFEAQRRFPNEEFCRFMGRNFFHVPLRERKEIKILETGCGSGANLWSLAKEGFDTYGIDISKEAIELSKKMLSSYNTTASLEVQNMANLNFPNDFFDAVIDVFSSYCLTRNEGGSI